MDVYTAQEGEKSFDGDTTVFLSADSHELNFKPRAGSECQVALVRALSFSVGHTWVVPANANKQVARVVQLPVGRHRVAAVVSVFPRPVTARLTALVITNSAVLRLADVGSRGWSVVHSGNGNIEMRFTAAWWVCVTGAPVVNFHDECCASILEFVTLLASCMTLKNRIAGGCMCKDTTVAHSERSVVVRIW